MNEEQVKSTSFLMTALRAIAAGTYSGICGKLMEYPADTVKVRLQTQIAHSDGTLPYTSAIDCFSKTFKTEGISGLYRGVLSPIAGAMAENAALFLLFEQSRKMLTQDGGTFGLSQVAAAGAVAGLGTSVILTPVDLIKTRLQVQQASEKSRLDAVKKGIPSTVPRMAQYIVQRHGLKGLFRGLTPTLMREIPGNAVWFLSYEFMYRQLSAWRAERTGVSVTEAGEQLSVAEVVLAGGTAGVMYWGVPYPIDTAKSVIQTSSENLTVGQALKRVYAARGMAGIYNGVGISVLRAFPTNAVIFLTYRQFQGWIDKIM